MSIDHADLLALVQPEPERQLDTTSDGWIYDLSSGEVVGRADVPEAFAIDCPEAADWALELRSTIEGEILALEARERALVAQLQQLRAAKTRALSWWEWKFGGQLRDFARRALEGRKERTWRGVWGSVAFRRVPGGTSIVSQDEAVAWMRERAPERIRSKTVESVTVKDVLAVAGEQRPGWLKVTEAGETCRISTGVAPEDGRRPSGQSEG